MKMADAEKALKIIKDRTDIQIILEGWSLFSNHACTQTGVGITRDLSEFFREISSNPVFAQPRGQAIVTSLMDSIERVFQEALKETEEDIVKI